LLKACQHAQINRLIHCSTADVVGRAKGNTISETISCRPVTKYAKLKLELERLIINGSKGFFDVSIIRPTSVFGPGGKNLKMLVDNLTEGNRLHNYFKHYLFGKRRMNLVHVENVVAALLFLTKCEKSFDKEVFFISDSDSPANNFSQVEHTFLQKLCLDYGFLDLTLPPSFLEFLLRLRERDNINPRRDYSPGKLISLGFVRPVSFESGLVEYANWYRKSHSLG
jgi:nucleoside-diphosphate-sugar epimerase